MTIDTNTLSPADLAEADAVASRLEMEENDDRKTTSAPKLFYDTAYATLGSVLRATGATAYLLGKGKWHVDTGNARFDHVDDSLWQAAAEALDLLAHDRDPITNLRDYNGFVEVAVPGPGVLCLTRGRERPRYFFLPKPYFQPA